eukprot:gb/GECG01002592.1/.p1 GENE.gb/GECG01002592.1/~~gb/GECG01002592.1/.p1  ORF type:complete len:136 (+),score=17.35 gb/GECG01002592.1/:1-408(+)
MMGHPRSVKSVKSSSDELAGLSKSEVEEQQEVSALPRMRERLKRKCKERIQEKRYALFQHIRSKSASPQELVQQICQQTSQQGAISREEPDEDRDLEADEACTSFRKFPYLDVALRPGPYPRQMMYLSCSCDFLY